MLNDEQTKKYIDLLINYESNPNWLNNFHQYRKSLIPNKIYRYRTISSYNLKALKRNYIWLNSPEKFNDVYDCILNIDSRVLLLYNILNNHLYKDTPFNKQEIEMLLQAEGQIKTGEMTVEGFISYLKQDDNHILHEKLTASPVFKSYKDIYDCLKQFDSVSEPNSRIFVKCKLACFSETYDNILMWSHYAKYNKGFCIEYDTSKCSEVTKNLYPVLYVSEPTFCPKLMNDYADGKADISISQTLFSTIKFKDWQYEKEWRLFGGEQSIKMPALPTCIYLGANIKQYDQKKLCKIADKLDIPVKKMKVIEGQYKLVADNIS